MRTKVTKDIGKIILRERRKNPLLGCRKLSRLLADKHGLKLSKSLINKFFKSRGFQEKKGRNQESALAKINKLLNPPLVGNGKKAPEGPQLPDPRE